MVTARDVKKTRGARLVNGAIKNTERIGQKGLDRRLVILYILY